MGEIVQGEKYGDRHAPPAARGTPIFDPNKAEKFDGEKKCRPELIPPEMLTALGTILAFGAEKYAPGNWSKGMQWSRMYGGLLRHLNAWAAGDESDPESGQPHLWHAACMLAFLLAHTEREIGEDDRFHVGLKQFTQSDI